MSTEVEPPSESGEAHKSSCLFPEQKQKKCIQGFIGFQLRGGNWGNLYSWKGVEDETVSVRVFNACVLNSVDVKCGKHYDLLYACVL